MSLPDGKDMTKRANEVAALVDGRQSPAAQDICRGTRRLLLSHGLATLTEVTLANGRRADVLGVNAQGRVWIVEVKSSVEDFRVDQKWPAYREFCDHLFFAVNVAFPMDLLPLDTGIIVADRFGAEILRDAPAHLLAAGRRKVLMTRLARTAALRLHSLADPDLQLENYIT
jgi:hypothetical protein